jgi:hypothetical protein
MSKRSGWFKGLVGLLVVAALALALAWLFGGAGQVSRVGQEAAPTDTPLVEKRVVPTDMPLPAIQPSMTPSSVPAERVALTATPQSTEAPLGSPAPLPADAIVFPVGQSDDNGTFKVLRYDPAADVLTEENVSSSLGNIRPPVIEFLLSPDRRFIALNLVPNDEGVPVPYVISVDGTEARLLPLSEVSAGRILAWIPGTDRLLVDGAPSGATVNLQGEDPLPLLGPIVHGGAASPDGEWLVLSSGGQPKCPDPVQNCFYFVKPDGTQGRYTPVPDKAWGGETPPEMTWSPDGKWIAYVDSFYEGWFQVRTVDADGHNLQKLGPEKMKCVSPAWSPDSAFLVYACAESETDSYRHWERSTWVSGIWLADMASGEVRQIVAAEGKASWWPTWLPDGLGIVFVSNRGGANDLWFVRPDGTGLRQLTFDGQIAD